MSQIHIRDGTWFTILRGLYHAPVAWNHGRRKRGDEGYASPQSEIMGDVPRKFSFFTLFYLNRKKNSIQDFPIKVNESEEK